MAYLFAVTREAVTRLAVTRAAVTRAAVTRAAERRRAGLLVAGVTDAVAAKLPATIAFLVVFRVLIKDFFWMVMARSSNLFWIEFHHSVYSLARAVPNQRAWSRKRLSLIFPIS